MLLLSIADEEEAAILCSILGSSTINFIFFSSVKLKSFPNTIYLLAYFLVLWESRGETYFFFYMSTHQLFERNDYVPSWLCLHKDIKPHGFTDGF